MEKNISRKTFAGEHALDSFLKQINILVCPLPLTAQTNSILNIDVFKKMLHPRFPINVRWDEHLAEEDLIYALDKKWLEGICLDVFGDEPLPSNHPFWNRNEIMFTPRAASITDPPEDAEQIVENYKHLASGQPLQHRVDRQKSY